MTKRTRDSVRVATRVFLAEAEEDHWPEIHLLAEAMQLGEDKNNKFWKITRELFCLATQMLGEK